MQSNFVIVNISSAAVIKILANIANTVLSIYVCLVLT